MGDRRKRMKFIDSDSILSVEGEEMEESTRDEEICGVGGREVGNACSDLYVFECGSFASRCSVKLIYEVVSKFDPSKKELVKCIGFQGILYFPVMSQINRRVSLWLMQSVDRKKSALNIGEHISISFNKYDVGHIFSIPSRGKVVLGDDAGSRGAKDRVIKRYLGQEFNERRSVKIVQEIVEREYSEPMSDEDADRFKVAFVVFVVSNLLCPSAKFDYAAVDYWNAIEDPNEICRYDWCDYVITKLFEGVTKLKKDMMNNIKYPSISGCALFLQVLYLDSLQLGGLSLAHDTLPRIRVFPFDVIRNMISADLNFLKHCKGDCGERCRKGITHLRDPSHCIYSWAVRSREPPVDCKNSSLSAIWDSVVAMVHLLNIPLEAAGPLFVALADFQDQINAGQSVTGNVAIKIITVLVTLMIPYARGFRYQSPYPGRFVSSGSDVVQKTINNGVRLLSFPISSGHGIGNGNGFPRGAKDVFGCNGHPEKEPIHLSEPPPRTLCEIRIDDRVQRCVQSAISNGNGCCEFVKPNISVASTMSRFFSVIRKLKSPNMFDLNSGDVDEGTSISSLPEEAALDCEALPSPWDMGYLWPGGVGCSNRFTENICSISDSDSCAIIHRDPKYIQVSSRDMRAQFCGRCEMELDLFDALVRVVMQEDDLMYSAYGKCRWRYILESDFMGDLLAGAVDLVDSSIKRRFMFACRSYDLRKTRMLFFPALLQCRWVCFVWQPSKNSIAVFDPSFDVIDPAGRLHLIQHACFMLKLGLKTLAEMLHTGSSCDVSLAELKLLKVDDKCYHRENSSGIMCSMFYRCYDGNDLRLNPTQVDVETVALKLFRQTRGLKGNTGMVDAMDDLIADDVL